MDSTAERTALISGSPSPQSKSRSLLEHARARLEAAGWESTVIELSALPADALLGRRPDRAVTGAIEAVLQARIIAAGSPVYRATYSGLLKVFMDLLAPDALVGRIAIPVLTGGSPGHLLALDHGMSPLFASIGATVVGGVYGFDAQFQTGAPDPALLARVDHAVDHALALSRTGADPALRPGP